MLRAFSSGSVVVVALLLVGTSACSDDDTGGGTTDAGANADTGGSDAATEQDSSSPDAASGKKAFGESCEADTECESAACFKGGSQHFCSIKCTMATAAKDCPSPPTSGQCNNQGYCRKP